MNPIMKAASVLLVRGSASPELFLVRRAEALRFFGGFHAFPGGKIAPADRSIALVSRKNDTHPIDASERCVAAVRELFEETGVLLARRSDGSFPPSGGVLTYLRRKMSSEDMPFDQVLDRLQVAIHADDLQPLGSLTTPPFVPHRFDSLFFLARLPENQKADVWPGELESGEWASSAGFLGSWARGQCLVSPPTVAILMAINELASDGIADALVPRLAEVSAESHPEILFAPHVQMIPLDTQSLPPSTHTNAYLVGSGPVYLLDPGTALPPEQARLFEVLDRALADGRRLTAIILTHHHPDHIGAAGACAARYRVPILAHERAAERMVGKVTISGTIADGERLDLGQAPGGGHWHMEAVLTPGHAPGHLAFYDPTYRFLYAGDMVSTLSSVVIAPPDGDLVVYLESLRHLRALEARLLLPSHGGPSARPRHTIDASITHRKRREIELLSALGAAPQSIPELASRLYKGLAPALVRFAELQILAGLTKLAGEGRAERVDSEGQGRWVRRD